MNLSKVNKFNKSFEWAFKIFQIALILFWEAF